MTIEVDALETAFLHAVRRGEVEYRWRRGPLSDRYTFRGDNVTGTARPLARRGLIWHPPGSRRPELTAAARRWLAEHPELPDQFEHPDRFRHPDGLRADETPDHG